MSVKPLGWTVRVGYDSHRIPIIITYIEIEISAVQIVVSEVDRIVRFTIESLKSRGSYSTFYRHVVISTDLLSVFDYFDSDWIAFQYGFLPLSVQSDILIWHLVPIAFKDIAILLSGPTNKLPLPRFASHQLSRRLFNYRCVEPFIIGHIVSDLIVSIGESTTICVKR